MPTTATYDRAKEDLESFIAESRERKSLATWFQWWHKRRAFVFPAFQGDSGGPKMNLAEVVHVSWVKRDKANMSLLDTAYADARDNVHLEVEYKAFCNGNSQGGTGPSLQDKIRQMNSNELGRAHALRQEFIRDDITDMDRTSTPSDQSFSPFSMPSDHHNASVTSRAQKATQDRPGRYRPTRSKAFLDRLEKAKLEKNSTKVKTLHVNREAPSLNCELSTSPYTEYRIHIGTQHSCDCQDFAKNRGKQSCKHIIWTLLHVSGIEIESEILQQISLTAEEIRQIVDSTSDNIPASLKFTARNSPRQNRMDRTANLLASDSCNGAPQIWYLQRQERERGQIPRCGGCRKEQMDGELCLSVTGLYASYEQNFVTETTFYFCPNITCIRRLPQWTNLKHPLIVHTKNSVLVEDSGALMLGSTSCNLH